VLPKEISGSFVPIGAHSLSLDDFTPDHGVRDPILHAAQKKVDAINAGGLHKLEKERRAVETWSDADVKMKEQHVLHASKDPDNLFMMYQAGVKPGWEQYKQMKLAPMIMQDSANRDIPVPIKKSYSEGLDVAGYWTQMHGARRGSVMKVQEVQKPGAMTKRFMNASMHMVVGSHDCETVKGISLPVSEEKTDIHDRYLAQDFKAGDTHFKAGELLTPDKVGLIRAAKKDAHVIVRSPLKCEHDHGFCQKCMGLSSTGQLHALGTNVGVIAAQTIGERAMQLTLKAFHTGGVKEQKGGGKLLSSFNRLEQLTKLHETIPHSASLAMTSGQIERMEHDRAGTTIFINGAPHHVGRDAAGNHLNSPLTGQKPDGWAPPKVGMHVEAGALLSDPTRTIVNPHDLLRATRQMDQVQNHLTREIYDLYRGEDVKRRHIEVAVKAMTNLTKVVNPGDHPSILRGMLMPYSVVQKINSTMPKGQKHITHEPVLKGIDMLPLSVQEDWMAKLQHTHLRDTIMEAAAVRGVSSLHGPHPIPAAAYGAEFGMTVKDSKKPGFGRLGNVPEHFY
jgi:DNA-directed RNA polymerase subunit beta'